MNIPLTENHGCACGHDHGTPELDARTIPHAIRHAAINGVVDSLQPGGEFILAAPHKPLPLIAEIEGRHGDGVRHEYVTEGPDVWRIRFTRTR